MVKNAPERQEARVQFLGWEDPLEKEIAAHSSILAFSHEQRSLVGYSPGGHSKSDVTEHKCQQAQMPTSDFSLGFLFM